MAIIESNYGVNPYYQQKSNAPTAKGTLGAVAVGALAGGGIIAGLQKVVISEFKKNPNFYEQFKNECEKQKVPNKIFEESTAKLKQGKLYWKAINKNAMIGGAVGLITYLAIKGISALCTPKTHYAHKLNTHQG